jgi:hypothetical protein
MEFGPYQIQIIVSLVVVVGAAFVALIVDFLKGNNEQLRELAIELKVRRMEDQQRSQTLIPQAVTASGPMHVGQALGQAFDRHTDQAVQVESAAAKLAVRQEPQIRENEREETRVRPAVHRSMAGSMERGRERKRTASPEALAAMERGAQLAASPLGQSSAAQRLAARHQAQVVQAAVETPSPSRVKAESVPAAIVEMTSASTRKKDWDSLLSRRRTATVTPATPAPANQDLLQAIVAETSVVETSKETTTEFPAGFHAGFQDGYILSHLVQSRRPVSGLVVSIGVNTPRNADGSMPEAVCNLIQSLIGADDFACQSSPEEFLLIYPTQRGASAQRKLSQIAQQLWDFQLRSLGTFSILFSWGGVEVRSESIEEAISAANERMQQTRRSRKLLSMDSREEMPLRKAV